MTRRRAGRAAVLALWLGLLLPATGAGAALWTLTASTLIVEQGQQVNIDIRLSNVLLLEPIGCLELQVPSAFKVDRTSVLRTSTGAEWRSNEKGSDPRLVYISARDNAGRLNAGEWVDFRVTVRAEVTGIHTWSAEIRRRIDCEGTQLATPLTLAFTVLQSGATASPPPATPSPTSSVSPSPPPSATPSPPPGATSSPANNPSTAPSQNPTSTSSAVPSAMPSETPPGSVTPSPTGVESTALPGATPVVTPSGDQPLPTAVLTEPENDSPPQEEPSPIPAVVDVGGTPPEAGWMGSAERGSPTELYETSGLELPSGFESLAAIGSVELWVVPALITGVPGTLVLLLLAANLLLGASWLPSVGRLLGPEPPVVEQDQHLWWAAGRPIDH